MTAAMKFFLHVISLAVLACWLMACGSDGPSSASVCGLGSPLTPDLARVYAEEEARLGWSAPEPLVYLAPSVRPHWESQNAHDPGRNWCISGSIVECPTCRRGWQCSRGEYRGYTEGCPTLVVADQASDREALVRHEAVHHLVFARTGDPDAAHKGGWW